MPFGILQAMSRQAQRRLVIGYHQLDMVSETNEELGGEHGVGQFRHTDFDEVSGYLLM